MELSIIIVNHNVRDLLAACLGSLRETCGGIDHEVIVVDNASADGSGPMVRKDFPRVILIENAANHGFAQANNQGFAVSRGEYVLLLNPDTVVKGDAIGRVLVFMKAQPNAGVATCRLVRANGEVQKSIRYYPRIGLHLLQALYLDRVFFPNHFRALYYRKRPFAIDYPSGAFMMVRRAALGGMPLLCDDYFMYSEEKDLTLRLRQRRFKTYFVPGCEIVHHGEQSTSQVADQMFLELQKSQVLFFAKHYRGWYGRGLALSWWLVLLSSYIMSIPLMLGGNRMRHRLFGRALNMYPEFLQFMTR